MENLEITDDDGDSFKLRPNDDHALLNAGQPAGVRLREADAHQVIAWLKAFFKLSEQEQVTAPELVIDVETETGKSRSVRWLGPDVPGELIKLAEIALRVPQGPAGPTLAERLRQEASPGSLAILRQVMGSLGCERVTELPERVQGLVQELDNLAGDIAQMAGVEIGPDGANLRALLEKAQGKHRAAIANTLTEAERKHAAARTAYEREIQKKINQHHAFRETVPAQIEAAMSQERNARAAVQAELESVRKQGVEARRQLRLSEDRVRAGEIAMDEVGEALRRAGITHREASSLVAAVQELARARDGLAGNLTEARTTLHAILNLVDNMGDAALTSHDQIADLARKSLKASNPDA